MYDIFLSYSTKDRERLMPLVRALEQQGWTVFWDHLSIQIGEDWRDTIEEAVSSCRCVVVAWSQNSVNSKWVREEATEGEGRKVLLPIRIDNVNPPFGFRSIQAGNFMGWNGQVDYFEFVRLSSQIRALMGGKAATPTQPAKPAWASAAGDDQYGRYADLNVKGVSQRFRWIEPGVFWMGSPGAEPQREDNEVRHQVTLSKGYWLGDTACTQSLWKIVVGSNPSFFGDDTNNPVEKVSWDDVHEFLQILNDKVPNLHARLPTEAEWEYACRAGTHTPFSFGENITTDQINYNGNPYWSGEKGLGRQRTIPVKSLPANPWGLYEIHGNVWEWCQDWYGDYPQESVIDPMRTEQGGGRIIRGGSWYNAGSLVRSAFRTTGRKPTDRDKGIGFRLAICA